MKENLEYPIFILEKKKKELEKTIKDFTDDDFPEFLEEFRDFKKRVKQLKVSINILKLHNENSKK
jgi:CRISPR/Cas system CSM-associated protein Csm4 (group 5 of RAMP superfamily)